MQDNQTASEAYESAAKRIQAALDEIRARLAAHANRQRGNPDRWDFVGDINHVASEIEQVATFLPATGCTCEVCGGRDDDPAGIHGGKRSI